jgi:uncharacterized membrane protein HdeD (DUF308 family)
MAKKEMTDAEHWSMHKNWKGCKMLVLGALVLINVYWPMVSWSKFIGGVLILAGLLKLATPYCKGCCKR